MKPSHKASLPAVVLMCGVLATTALVAVNPEETSQVSPAKPPLVRVLEIQPRTARLVVRAHGIVEPRTESELVIEVAGRIVWVSLNLDEGGFFQAGETLGGIFEVKAFGVPVGLGSYVHWDRRLDTDLAAAIMSIPAIKGVQIGAGFEGADLPGSQVHDAISHDRSKGFYRETNRAGGVEGGVSNGEPVVLSAAMKPIPTLMAPLGSVHFLSKRKVEAAVERSDVTAVPAACVIAESMVAWVLDKHFCDKFGGDSIDEMQRKWHSES